MSRISRRSSYPDAGPPEMLSAVTVGIVGLGYVGLPTALGLVEAGVRVLGCDVSETRLAAIKTGQVDLLAADHERLGRFLGAEELVLTTEPRALAAADVVIICVPTPVDGPTPTRTATAPPLSRWSTTAPSTMPPTSPTSSPPAAIGSTPRSTPS